MCLCAHAGVCTPAQVLMFDEGLGSEEGGVVWLFMPRCVVFGLIHRRMTCELQRVASISVCACVWAGRFGGGQGSHKKFSSSGCIVVEITNVSI